jgi:PAS domain S-box-containing protein
MKTAAELLNGERGGLFLYQVNEQVLELVAHYVFEATPVGTKLQIGQGLAGKVWQLDSPLVVENYREWPDSIPELVPIIEDRSVIGITLQRGDEKLGVLTLTAKDGHVYTQRDVELLSLFTSGAAVAIQNARLHLQQQQAEIALRESEATARVLLNAPPDVMLLLDKSGMILDLNETAAKSLGQPASPQMNQVSMHDIFTGEVANVRLQALEKVFATGKAVYFEDERNGRWFDNSVYPIFDTQGQVARIAVYARNISAQKAAQAERESLIADLEAKNEELERFTYTVSHDLKSPLVTIMGFLGFVEKDAATGNLERLAEDIAKIRGAAEKMKRLLNDLLELSRIGRLINPPVAVSFSEIVQEALAVVSGQIVARGVQVTVADNLPIVKADRVRLVEVVQNLVDNAVRFMGDQPAPHIQIGVRPDEQMGQPIFFVQDNGIGIASQYHENIFGLFNRLNPNTAGTGIGLALVKRIIETHGGQIWVESAVGQGSTFCFTLGV